ncbi:MAG TPA: 7-cyano-7-deazaguanine synthase QueC [Gemmatimonadales bacterium]|jgi:7-cyano-7-deazaguanine synthase|nr:7-cyano-7-deazaguanine synthase QueC [Gemmatimonadales bacterium]
MAPPIAVVLLSGGLDSATVAAIALAAGFDVAALSFRYGQRHGAELAAAARVAESLGVTRRLVLDVDLRPIGGSALTGDLPVPKDRPAAALGADIPSTYVPARNTIFLSLALAWAEVLGARDIFIGANAVDYSGYPDCRPEYLHAFEHLARLATRAGAEGAGLTVHAPLLALSKAGIIARGAALGVDYGRTVSCYDPDDAGAACGRCDACQLRRRGFEESGIPDPTRYQAGALR